MNIGEAVNTMKAGQPVRRAGWNGKGMYLVYQKGYPDGIAINQNTADATRIPLGTVCKFLPYIMMCTVQGAFVPWLCSQTDLLADDWQIVNGCDAEGHQTCEACADFTSEIEDMRGSV